jgi:hypothetical protein
MRRGVPPFPHTSSVNTEKFVDIRYFEEYTNRKKQLYLYIGETLVPRAKFLFYKREIGITVFKVLCHTKHWQTALVVVAFMFFSVFSTYTDQEF